MKTIVRFLSALCVLAVTVVGARADIGPPVSEADLLRASDLVATGHVQTVDAGRDPVTNNIYTYVTIELTEVLWGAPGSRVVTLKQLGGTIGDETMVVVGQAKFAAGEDVLFFAETRPRDRSLYTASLWQGKWSIQRESAASAQVASRAAPSSTDRGVLGQDADREALEAMLQRLRDAIRQLPPAASLPLNVNPDNSDGDQVRVTAPFSLFDTPGRWNEFDTRTGIPVDIQSGGQQGLSGGGIAQIVNAFGLWANATPLVFLNGSATTRCQSQAANTGRISIAFMDPCAEISNASNTLAIGGYYCAGSGGRTIGGYAFCRISGGFIINNDNQNTLTFYATGACFQAAETHEIGHTLGLNHSTVNGATMFPTISNNCRTAAVPLASDDINGIRFIYPTTTTTSAPGAPSGLTATATGSSVVFSWRAPTTGGAPTAYILEVGSNTGLTNLANFNTGNTGTSVSATSVASGVYFARVRATNASGTSAPSNEFRLVVGGTTCTGPPSAPGPLTVLVNSGGTVIFSWFPSASGSPTSYILEAGSARGLANIANVDLGSSATSATATGVTRGMYYMRVRGRNACGTSAPSGDLPLLVP